MADNTRKLIAVFGATGMQGGSVVRALSASGEFRVRALTRTRAKFTGTAHEVVEADLNRPETLTAALEGAYGVFLVTNFWEPGGADEFTQGSAVVDAAKRAGVQHFVWSTLPNVQELSAGTFDVPHFTDKAKVDALVNAAGFKYRTFVLASFFYQNLLMSMTPQKQQDGSMGWTLPIDPASRSVHMGDITEIGRIVAGAFAKPELAGHGEHLALAGDLLSFNDVVTTLNGQGHHLTFNQVPGDVFANFFPGAREVSEMLGYFQAHTYLGKNAEQQIALANKVAGVPASRFSDWARANMPANAAQPQPVT